MSHIFISYAHEDSEYAHRLANAISERGYKVWIDDRIEYGERWQEVLQESIGNCAAFIILLSDNSEKSDWCKKELAFAQEKKKYILPVMLSGKLWLALADTQYVKVEKRELPNASFFVQISKLSKKKKGAKEIVKPTTMDESGSTMDNQLLSRTLNMAQKSLVILEEQAAGYTNLTIPVPLRIQLDEKRKEVEELKKKSR